MLVLSGVISMFACAVPMFFYKVTEKRQAEMVAEIEARKAKAE
jgi:Na+/melibiose symporter-like transporter